MSTWMIVRGRFAVGRTDRREPRRPRSVAVGRCGRLGRPLLEALDLVLEKADAIRELLERARERVGQVDLVQVDLAADALAIARGDAPGDAHHDRVRGHLANDDRSGPDAAAG